MLGALAALGAASPFLAGCVAEGTDFEALPFVAIDKTNPDANQVTVPLALTAFDEGPASRIVRGPNGGTIDQEISPDERAIRLSIFHPVITYARQGREHEFHVFAPIANTISLFAFGPVARLLGPADVAAHPFVYPRTVFGSSFPTTGGIGLFPLFAWDSEHLDPADPGHDTKRDFGLFPLFMGGEWPLKGKYFALAPFGGTTYGFLGKDQMTWIGFPYPFYLYSREREVESRHVLFPFVNWVEGGGRTGFRVWPFYAHYKRTDLLGRLAYDRHWVMWPFVSWARNAGQQGTFDDETGVFKPTPTEELFVFPFYGQIVGPDDKNYTVLWPFFRYEEVPSANYWELRAPFPFFIMHHGNDPALVKQGKNGERVRFDIWPLAGYRSRPGYVRHFFVWPIERYEAREDDWVRDTKFYFLPFLAWHHHLEKDTQEEYQHTRGWPFFVYRRGTKGDVEFHTLAPILWDDPNGFERIWFPFFRLYEYRRTAAGGHGHRFLFGLASWRDEPPAEGATEGYSRLSLLFGLFQFRSGGTNVEQSVKSGLRLFFLPEISWGGSE